MILTIDIGNSTVVFGLFHENGELLFRSALESLHSKTADQWAIDLNGVFQLYGHQPYKVKGAIMSSVVPPVTGTIFHAIFKVTGKEPIIVSPELNSGLSMYNNMKNQLGSDIIANCVAALHKYEGPMLVIDMGTATTVSLIDDKGVYYGIFIIPGMGTMLEALSQRAAQLPFISIDLPDAPPIMGTNTVDAMQGGILYGNAALLDGIIERIEQVYGKIKTVVTTGGNARFVVKYCKYKVQNDQHLLLEGLFQLYKLNGGGDIL
jgi:pantothenate kinase, type III